MAILKEELIKKAKQFDQNNKWNRDYVENAITEFNTKFDKKELNNLKLDNYVFGKSETFSYYLDQKYKKFAVIGGRSALQFIVWYNTNDNNYLTRSGTGKKEITKEEAEIIFEEVKRNIIKIVSLAEEGKFREIDEISKPEQKARMKLVYMYYPEKTTSIMTKQHINKICDNLGISYDQNYPVESNHKILSYIKSIDSFKNWHSDKIGAFFYNEFDLKGKGENNTYNKPVLNFKTKNIIFYGPPGTGKTYRTKKYSVSVLENG